MRPLGRRAWARSGSSRAWRTTLDAGRGVHSAARFVFFGRLVAGAQHQLDPRGLSESAGSCGSALTAAIDAWNSASASCAWRIEAPDTAGSDVVIARTACRDHVAGSRWRTQSNAFSGIDSRKCARLPARAGGLRTRADAAWGRRCASRVRGWRCWPRCTTHPHADTHSISALVRDELGDVSQQAVYDVLRRADRRAAGAAHPRRRARSRATSRGSVTTITTSCAAPAASSPTSTAPSARRPVLTASDDHGFVIDEAEVVYWGVCPACSSVVPVLLRKRSPLADQEQPNAVVGDMNEPIEAEGVPGRARSCSRTRPRATRTASWWPDRLNLKILAKNPAVANPLGEDFDYTEAFKALDLAAVKADIAGRPDHVAGLVARRLRSLRPVHDPHGLAQRRHLPHQRRPRWRAAPASSASRR